MSLRRRVPLPAAATLALVSLAACNAIIGTRDLNYQAAGDAGLDSAPDTTSPPPADADTPDTEVIPDAAVDASDGACSADLQTDKKHCGRCGHDCQGGDCAAGVCKPVLIADAQGKPLGITLLNGVLYWTNSSTNEVWRARTDGADVGLFAKGTFRQPWGITNDGSSIYFAAAFVGEGGVFRCAATGCTTPVQLSSRASYDVAHNNGFIFFTNRSDATLSRVGTSGAGEANIVGVDGPFHVAVDSAYAYVTSNEFQIKRIPHFGNAAVSIGDNSGELAGGIFVDDTRVYWNYANSTGPGATLSVAKAGGTATSYADSRNPLAIAADTRLVYWVTLGSSSVESERNDGKVLACPIAGCSASGAIVVADGLLNGSALALDADTIYFTEIGVSGSGRVRKVAKP